MNTALQIFFEDPGIFIGLGFVLAATWFLPARIRWYVFTAGIAVVAFRSYQIYWAKKRMKELDRQREDLKKELASLQDRHRELERKNVELNKEFVSIKNERNKLLKQRTELENKSGDLSKEKQELDQALAKKDVALADNRQKANNIIDFLGSVAKTGDQLSDQSIH